MLRAARFRLFWFFAPFSTPRREKTAGQVRFGGDYNCLALAEGVENLWDPRALTDEGAPTDLASYVYLKRYGY